MTSSGQDFSLIDGHNNARKAHTLAHGVVDRDENSVSRFLKMPPLQGCLISKDLREVSRNLRSQRTYDI